MKISYLIIAHNNFEHLNRLIDALDDSEISFYVHVDKKAVEEYIPSKNNVTVIPNRFSINWGGYNMIEATLALMEYAISHSSDSDYFILVSGVDYPVRSRSFLLEQLSRKKEFIDAAPLPFPDKPMGRFEYYYFDCNRRKYGYFHPLIFIEMGMRLFKMKRKIPFQIYVGGQWFALTKACTQYILDTVEKDKRYEQFFRHSLIPDEAFFQTIIAHSPFASEVVPNMTYTDWNVPNPPATIEENHIEILEENVEFADEYGTRYPCFARKFDNTSGNIVSQIERRLRAKD